MKVKNAKQVPKIYYGLHMSEGVAEYREDGKDTYRICILENTIKKMDSTFQGKPVFVLHSEDDLKDILADIQERADGYVIESFFNQADGKHWAKFIVVSDKGHDAVSKGWRLSNAYVPQTIPKNGQWHGVDYQREVVDGNYDHLAIVPNPRYEESVIMTPEQFKAYNNSKLEELSKIANSKNETKEETLPMKALSFFKKQKVEKIENAQDLETLTVTLPESKKEMTVLECVTLADKVTNMQGYANGDHMVKIGEEELSVNDLMKKYGEVCNEMAEMKKKNEDGGDDSMENKEDEADMDDKKDEKKENEEDDKEEKKKNALSPEDQALLDSVKKANILKLQNAPAKALKAEPQEVILNSDRVAKGKVKYGSK